MKLITWDEFLSEAENFMEYLTKIFLISFELFLIICFLIGLFGIAGCVLGIDMKGTP